MSIAKDEKIKYGEERVNRISYTESVSCREIINKDRRRICVYSTLEYHTDSVSCTLRKVLAELYVKFHKTERSGQTNLLTFSSAL